MIKSELTVETSEAPPIYFVEGMEALWSQNPWKELIKVYPMAEVKPFSAVVYDPARVRLFDVVAPPYDIVTEKEREGLYNRSPFNILHVDYGREYPDDNETSNKYTRAQKLLKDWLSTGILKRVETPSFYGYQLEYKIQGKTKILRGIIGLVKIEEFGSGNIHPHEATHSKPKTDRLMLMRICQGNLSPIFALYKSNEKRTSRILHRLNKRPPYFSFTDDEGIVHSFWIISSLSEIETITKELSDKAIFIADGHHRYEVALEYKKEMALKFPHDDGTQPSDYVMMFLANIADEGLTILPTHRLVRELPKNWAERLKEHFEVAPFRIRNVQDIIKKIQGHEHTIGLYTNGNGYILKYLGKDLSTLHPALRYLDVNILHKLIFEQLLDIKEISYEMSPEKVFELVSKGDYEAGFFLNATKVEEVEVVALSSLRMPPKSTYFYPKLKTGMAINLFEYSFVGDERDSYGKTESVSSVTSSVVKR